MDPELLSPDWEMLLLPKVEDWDQKDSVSGKASTWLPNDSGSNPQFHIWSHEHFQGSFLSTQLEIAPEHPVHVILKPKIK